jgi:hypothetical protein
MAKQIEVMWFGMHKGMKVQDARLDVWMATESFSCIKPGECKCGLCGVACPFRLDCGWSVGFGCSPKASPFPRPRCYGFLVALVGACWFADPVPFLYLNNMLQNQELRNCFQKTLGLGFLAGAAREYVVGLLTRECGVGNQISHK